MDVCLVLLCVLEYTLKYHSPQPLSYTLANTVIYYLNALLDIGY